MINVVSSLKKVTLVHFILLTFLTYYLVSCKKKVVVQILPEVVVVPPVIPPNSTSPYVNGADITTLLQTEVNEIKQIEIPKGTYYLSKPITKTSGTLNVKGTDVIIQLKPTFESGKSSFSAAFVLTGLTTINMEGITIDGNRANLVNAGTDWTNFIMGIKILNSNNIKLTKCGVINAPSISFDLSNSNNIIIDQCVSTNGMYHGVVLSYCTNGTVSNSRIIGIGNQGNDTKKGGIGILGIGGDHFNFVSNHIEDISDTGTKTEGSNYVTWTGNTVRNSGKDGIKFQNLLAGQVSGGHPPVKTVYEGKILNNTIDKIFNGRSDGSAFIQLLGAENVTVSGNLITGGAKTGQEDGICVWSNTDVMSNNITVSNNTIKNTNRFIYLNNVSNNLIQENICENLVAPTNQYDGFVGEFSDKITVSKNQFRRSGTGMIDGFALQLFDCSNFVIKGNRLENAYNAISLRLVASVIGVVSDNQIDKLSSYPITVYSNIANTIVNSLMITGNIVTRSGITQPYSSAIRFDLTNITINNLDLSNTKLTGNGTNGNWALAIQGAKKVGEVILTNFGTSGNVTYPTLAQLTGVSKITGWKSSSSPTSGTWSLNAIVYNINETSPILGWKCIVAGTPGIWQEIR